MPPTKPSLDIDPYERVVTLRGVAYHLRELSGGEYDDLQRKFSTTKVVNGDEIEVVDNRALLRAMVVKCCTDPRLTAATLSDLPVPVLFKLNNAVNSMHFDELPEDKSEPSDEEDAKKGEG